MDKPLVCLIDEIIQAHHEYLRQELPSILELLNKMVKLEGERQPKWNALKAIFIQFFIETNTHLTQEENLLFPMIRKIEEPISIVDLEQVQALVAILEKEHETLDALMIEIATLTKEIRVNQTGSSNAQIIFDKLHQLEIDMEIHAHKEDHVLFPQALSRSRKSNF